ncbi:2-hydroxyacid dehydrogenase [Desulfobacula phenolica]|uniref:Glycerate dehydrogenase n=1 Tax=Desulfobacula phenolica TaxID=90732 RepID=A0A1H2DNE6_9BACT|nr:2-hydroxyacid dehydrogenase [Desulfobacula phenolica]SDT84457.1 glycerate dehydrogenase [Desulfobacula phenolica]
MNVLYIGVCKKNLELYYPSYIRGRFLDSPFTDDQLVATVKQHRINVLMVDVFHSSFNKCLLNRLKDHVRLINFSYQSIESLIDMQEAKRLGILVKKLPDDLYCNEVAEFAITQLLCACKGSFRFDRDIRNGEWNQAAHTNFSMNGKTLGIVGYGNIGKRIASLCKPWGMKILVTKKSRHMGPQPAGITIVDFPTLISQSDFIILAVPIKKDTYQMVDRVHIQKLKKNTIIVNISRGNIVDEKAIAEGLEKGNLYQYCTDVFSQEPIDKNHELVKSNKTILSPHIAWATDSSLKKTYDIWFGQTTI